MKHHKKTFILIGGILTSLLTMAEQPDSASWQPFIGIKTGYQWGLDDSYKHSNPRAGIWGIYGGLQLSPSLSWDLGYQHHNTQYAKGTDVIVETWIIESALRYDLYLQERLSLYGRFGFTYSDNKKTRLSLERLEASGFSPLGELGIGYHLSPNIRLLGGYQYIHKIGSSNTGHYDSHGLLVGLSYSFGGSRSSTLTVATPITLDDKPIVDEIVDTQSNIGTFDGFSLGNDFSFAVDSTRLDEHFSNQLTEVSNILKAHPQSRAVIVGHTDSTGSAIYNQKLSERRADAVATLLIEQGVNTEQLAVLGKGESSPIATNSTAEGRALNRRVEITIPSFQYQK